MRVFIFLLIGMNALHAIDLELSASVVSDNQKMITSRYMGIVKKMHVSEGDIVRKGQTLYEIDSREIDSKKEQVDLAISQAQLALQMNKNQYSNILLNLGRYKRLFQKGMVSKYELENLELAATNTKDMVSIASKQVSQAKAMRKEVLNQYNYLKLTAPNAGVIISKTLSVGEMAMPGMPGLILTDLSKISIIVDIAENDIKFMKLGKKVKVEVPSMGFSTSGKIYSIIPSSNPMTHKFKMKIEFDSKDKSIYPGMYAKVYIKG